MSARVVIESGYACVVWEGNYPGIRGSRESGEAILAAWLPHVAAALSEGRCPKHVKERLDEMPGDFAHDAPWLLCVPCGGVYRHHGWDDYDYEPRLKDGRLHGFEVRLAEPPVIGQMYGYPAVMPMVYKDHGRVGSNG